MIWFRSSERAVINELINPSSIIRDKFIGKLTFHMCSVCRLGGMREGGGGTNGFNQIILLIN